MITDTQEIMSSNPKFTALPAKTLSEPSPTVAAAPTAFIQRAEKSSVHFMSPEVTQRSKGNKSSMINPRQIAITGIKACVKPILIMAVILILPAVIQVDAQSCGYSGTIYDCDNAGQNSIPVSSFLPTTTVV